MGSSTDSTDGRVRGRRTRIKEFDGVEENPLATATVVATRIHALVPPAEIFSRLNRFSGSPRAQETRGPSCQTSLRNRYSLIMTTVLLYDPQTTPQYCGRSRTISASVL